MKPFSEDLLAKLENATVAPSETRPRVLLGTEEVVGGSTTGEGDARI